MASEKEPETAERFSIASQAWFSLAFWLSVGLLLEGLIGFRAPAYLQDEMRRELFRLAHAHGTLLSLLLLIVALYLASKQISPPNAAIWPLRVGTVLMPVGFLLGGIWHTETDPNFLVFLAPLGGILLIFGIVVVAFSSLRKQG